MPDLRQLRHLVAVVDHRGFQAAATALGITQPVVSRSVQALEEELGTALVDRRPGRVAPTQAGRVLLDHARRAITSVDAATDQVLALAGGTSGELSVGIGSTPLDGRGHELFGAYAAAYPNVSVRFTEAIVPDLRRLLEEREVDVCYIADLMLWPGPTTLPLWNERVYAALPATHPLARRAVLMADDFAGQTVLVQGRRDAPDHRSLFARTFNVEARYRYFGGGFGSLLAGVALGEGLVLAPAAALTALPPGVIVKSITGRGGEFGRVLAWPPDVENPVLGRFIAFARDRFRARAGASAPSDRQAAAATKAPVDPAAG